MESFIIYITKSTICITILYSIYWFFLRKDTFFVINRFYLIGSIVFSLIVPLLSFKINMLDVSSNYSYVMNTITISSNTLQETYFQNFLTAQLVLIIYIIGAVLFLLRFLLQLLQLSRLVKRFGITNKEGLHIVFTDADCAPFSFLNLMFISRNIQTTDAEKIIAHEQIHVKQRHTFDIFILELIIIFQWFNPIVWFCKYSLKEIHEYLADEGVLLKGYGKINYQQLLLSLTLGANVNDLVNSFNTSLIKKRFIMMTKMKSSLNAKFKILLAIPFIATYLIVFSCNKNKNSDSVTTDKVTALENNLSVPPPPSPLNTLDNNLTETTDKVYNKVEVMPEFKGGQSAFVEYLTKNIKYPKNAKEKGKRGKVFVSFLVDKTGDIKNVKIQKSVDPELDAEAIRCISSMPNWIPGKDKGKAVSVVLSLPISFNLK